MQHAKSRTMSGFACTIMSRRSMTSLRAVLTWQLQECWSCLASTTTRLRMHQVWGTSRMRSPTLWLVRSSLNHMFAMSQTTYRQSSEQEQPSWSPTWCTVSARHHWWTTSGWACTIWDGRLSCSRSMNPKGTSHWRSWRTPSRRQCCWSSPRPA